MKTITSTSQISGKKTIQVLIGSQGGEVICCFPLMTLGNEKRICCWMFSFHQHSVSSVKCLCISRQYLKVGAGRPALSVPALDIPDTDTQATNDRYRLRLGLTTSQRSQSWPAWPPRPQWGSALAQRQPRARSHRGPVSQTLISESVLSHVPCIEAVCLPPHLQPHLLHPPGPRCRVTWNLTLKVSSKARVRVDMFIMILVAILIPGPRLGLACSCVQGFRPWEPQFFLPGWG